MFWIIIISFVVLVTLAIVIYTMPAESVSKPKKKSKEQRPELIPDPVVAGDKTKDWKSIAERWERQNNALLGDVEKLKMQQKNLDKELEAHKAQHKEVVEKLSQEKSWREKEQVNLDKAKTLEKDLKDQIYRTENDLEKEHSKAIRLEQQLGEIKIKHDSLQEEKRALSTKAMSLETTLEQANKELAQLRKQNAELSRKKEDVQWVAKSQFDELKKQLEQKKQDV